MEVKRFIKQHITVDNRRKVSIKIKDLIEKYNSFAYYLNLIQKESVAKMFILLEEEKYLFYGLISNDIVRHSYRLYINILLANGFIEIVIPEDKFIESMASIYNQYVANNTNYYRLTKKGNDFIKINYVKEYLETEYIDFIEYIRK